jgi:hypothetical protein
MTKKHFIALADEIKHSVVKFDEGQLQVLVRFCASQNPRFNAERWLDYVAGKCGPNGEKK